MNFIKKIIEKAKKLTGGVLADNTPMDVVLFDLEMNLSDRFHGTTPIFWREQKARDVFSLLVRFNAHARRNSKKKKNVIRRPASDNAGWW